MSNISYARGNPGPKSQVNKKKAHQKRTKGIEDCWELSSGRSRKIKRLFLFDGMSNVDQMSDI